MNKEGIYIKEFPKAKTILKIGKGRNIVVELDKTFNWLQKKMWKILLNIEVEDVE